MPLGPAINGAARRVPVWAVWIAGLAPAAWLFWQAATGGLGVEPVEALEHRLGELALQLLIAGLAVTPLRRHLGVNLMRFRRALGLLAFTYVCLHLAVWLLLDVQTLARVWEDVLKRPYITVGMAGFLLLIPLAVTSNDWSVRRLGSRWRRLHRLSYLAAVLGGLHFLLLAKGFQLEPLLYAGAILGLLALRLRLPRRQAA
ncbi:protein-methionine-sulfoxide reductase heme-binding subunit MsrQ [Rhodosalinus halophilus]|uniref:Protein-methionine-sulfoxide reductase heme-binding subunit MsrQ n=1 Tax=Rhodosalinus halophilus TaxID=2259333 RepID=A0A365U8J0_9RHOB|nr:protein-methionine-sulfoxide reductase heme-binding subunit MsrQ [Rhodosalinus halophilus]RBI84784.1 protein-methionine-sulfoxide reductase heme-binding subunit MsrQ [Rhodosalinus halophilus]